MGFAYRLPLLMRLHPKRIGFSSSLAVLMLICAVLVTGQTRPPSATAPTTTDTSGSGSLRGRVLLPGGGFLSESVGVVLQNMRGVEASVFTDSQGQFQFNGLTPGIYEVVAEGDRRRFETTTQQVEVRRGLPSIVNIYFKEKSGTETKPANRAVSAGELDPNVPVRAKKEFEQGASAGKEGKTDEAIEHFRKAVEIYPRYLMARNDLGAQLLEQGRLDEAEEELRRALDIDPASFNPTLNLGIVLVKKHEFQTASEVLDKANSLQGDSPAARLYFGVALLGISDLERAEKELKTAYSLGGTQYAEALFHLGQLYLSKGDREAARHYLETYLRDAPNGGKFDQVKKLIAALN